MNKRMVRLAAALSGAGALIFELVWTRYLEIVLGGTSYAVGTVTACYMVGLALGSFLLGRLADRWSRKVIVAVFFGFGLLCALSPMGYQAVRVLALYLDSSLAAKIAIAFTALLLPTSLVGGMIPAMVAGHGESASEGEIYAFHTLGSVIGVALAGFWAIGTIGLKFSLLLAGLLSVSSGTLLLPARPDLGRDKPQISSKPKGRVYNPCLRRASVVVYTISGFTAMAFQMYQTKLLSWFFMDSVYDFAVILTVFLTGSALGNFLFSSVSRRDTNHVAWLMGSQLLLGTLTISGLFLVQKLPYWTAHIQRASQLYPQFGASAWLVSVLLKMGISAVFLLPTTVLWGGAFPLVSRICQGDERQQGSLMGYMLGWNTVGSALGSLMGSFVIVTLIGLRKAILLNGAMNVAASGILFFCGRPKGKERWRALWATVPALAALLLPAWNQFEMSTSFLEPGQDVEGYVDYLYYNEDSYGVTTVVNFLPNNQKYLVTNRLYCQNTSVMGGPEDHRRLGYIPLLLKPDASRMLVTGLGAGMTLDGAASRSQVQVDCVEISQSVIEAAQCFEEENHDVMNRENVTVIQDDARSYVARCTEQYDLIVGDIFFPMSSGSSNLFSLEYYQDCRNLLSDDGMMVQWLPLHQFSKDALDIAINTFDQVFDNAYLWLGMIGNDIPVVGVVGTKQSLKLPLEDICAIYEQEKELADSLGETALDDPYMFLSHFVVQVEHDQTVSINTDDCPILEYMVPKIDTGYSETGMHNLGELLERKESCLPYIEESALLDEYLLALYDEEIEEFIQYILEFAN